MQIVFDDSSADVTIDRDVAIVRVRGLTGLAQMEELGRCLKFCAREPLVRSVCLAIDSAGGHGFGLPDLEPVMAATAAAIAAKGGRVAVHIEGRGCSGGYLLACLAAKAAGAPISAGPASLVGSIGAYIALSGTDKLAKQSGQDVEVISSGSEKGLGVYGTPITDAMRRQAREIVDDEYARFRGAVMAARQFGPEQMDRVGTGAVWTAARALDLGLIDEIVTLPQLVARLAALPLPAEVAPGVLSTPSPEEESMSTPSPEEKSMSTPTPPTLAANANAANAGAGATPAALAAPVAAATAAQLKAEFGADPAFCFAQIEAGATLDQARSAWAARSAAVVNDLQKTVADLTAKVEDLSRARRGGTPVADAPLAAAASADGSENLEQFQAAVKAMAETAQIHPLAAVAKLAKKPAHAAGYAAWRRARGLVD
jgi:protease-4